MNNIDAQKQIIWLPILFSYKQWFDEKDDQNLIPLMVKVAMVRHCTDLAMLSIELVDVFLVDPVNGVMPPAPKTSLQITSLLTTILNMVEQQEGLPVQLTDDATIIYGGKDITTKFTTNHNNHNNIPL